MAKGVSKAPYVRPAKPKTAKQMEKAARNVERAKLRNERLAAEAKAKSDNRKANLEDYRHNLHRAENEAAFVQTALNGPSGNILRNWLKNRPAMYPLVKRFFDERPKLKVAA